MVTSSRARMVPSLTRHCRESAACAVSKGLPMQSNLSYGCSNGSPTARAAAQHGCTMLRPWAALHVHCPRVSLRPMRLLVLLYVNAIVYATHELLRCAALLLGPFQEQCHATHATLPSACGGKIVTQPSRLSPHSRSLAGAKLRLPRKSVRAGCTFAQLTTVKMGLSSVALPARPARRLQLFQRVLVAAAVTSAAAPRPWRQRRGTRCSVGCALFLPRLPAARGQVRRRARRTVAASTCRFKGCVLRNAAYL